MATLQTARKPTTRVKGAKVAKPKVERKKAVKATPKPKETGRPARQECSICATTKTTARSFKAFEAADACEHFLSICSLCIQKMMKAKIAERQLSEPALGCPFPNCDHVLDLTALKKTMSKAAYKE